MPRPYRLVALVLAIMFIVAWGLSAAEPSAGKEGQTIQKALPSKSSKKQLRTGEAAIEEALAKPVHFEFDKTPLTDVIQQMKERCGIEIQLGSRALGDVGIKKDTPITAHLHGVSLRSGLNLLLRPYDLTWTILDDVLYVTTPEEEENIMTIKVYDVSDLVVTVDASGEQCVDFDHLIDIITSTVSPTSWSCSGSPDHVVDYSFGNAKLLIVSQTYQIQYQIAKLLDDLHEIVKKHPNAQRPSAQAYGTPPLVTFTRESCCHVSTLPNCHVGFGDFALGGLGSAGG